MNNDLTTFEERTATLVEIRGDATRFPRLYSMRREEAVGSLKRIVYVAMMYRNQAATPEQISFTAEALYNELMRKDDFGTRFITIEETARIANRLALDPGTFGISVTTLYGAVVSYCKTEGRQADKEARARKEVPSGGMNEDDARRRAAMIAKHANNMTTRVKVK